MTAYNSECYIKDAVLSLLEQTHTNLEIVIVDDASTDRTFDLLLELAAQDSRVRPIKMFRNRGTYWCKNLGITRSTGRYVTFQDSDDKSDVSRLRRQLDELQRHDAVMCTCNYVRQDPHGQIVLNRGSRERKAIMAPLIDKNAVLQHAGYFDSVRTSADDEFNRRIGVVFGHERVCHIDEALYYATVREGSLTNSMRTKAEIGSTSGSNSDQSFLSAPRREYVRQYTAWHERLKTGAGDPVTRFPQLRRPFPAPAFLMAEPTQHDSYVTASMASIPLREAMLEHTVESILPQVDFLNVYLNGYETTPPYLRNPQIHAVHSAEYGDRRDNGKFFFLDSLLPGYHFTIDDDILYPPDYVQKTILKIEQYGRKAIVGCHGVNLATPLVNFMKGREVMHFKRALRHDRLVNLLGTGTVAYHITTIDLSLDDFKEPGMADLWLAVAAKRQNVPMIAIERSENWLQPIVEADESSLYSAAINDCRLQTTVAKAEEPWRLDELCERYELVQDLLRRFSVEEIRYGGLQLEDALPLAEAH